MSDHGEFCPVYASINILQEKWTLHIIRALLAGPLGFNELGRAVGANPTTLTQRLDRLEREGIVSRTVQSTMPPKTSYQLTAAGVALQDVVDAIERWARAHLKAPAAEPGGAKLRAEAAARAHS